MSAQALELRHIAKRFGPRTILDAGPVRFEPGQLHLVEGDNGAGKSTLLKCLGGLATADRIDLCYGAIPYTGGAYPHSLRRAIVYVHQHPYLLSAGVIANIEYGLRCRGVDALARQQRVRHAVEWAGLEASIKTVPRKLSGGEKQRLALARAAALDTPALLVDEPTANLDRAAREQVHHLLDSLVAKGTLVIVATHDPSLHERSGARRWVLAEGSLSPLG
ncbi:MAG TPA: ATP-binding cassette domain-containing protein [Usitatibacteraceae bacterium]|nr:ATP-binding cassette domain-containing protein [Usitatibacteraceae bacterium]